MEYGKIKLADGSEKLISRSILGTARFGASTDEDTAFALMDRFFEKGGNAFDTARIYAGGSSEKLLGKWIRSRGVRNEVFVITKGAHPPLTDMHASRLDRASINDDMEKSLEAAGLDRFDLYYLHRDDVNRDVADILTTLNGFIGQGLALSLGASNWKAKRIAQANAWAKANGKTGFAASEIQWSYADFTPAVRDHTLVGMDDAEEAAYSSEPLLKDMAVMAFSPLSHGVFQMGYKADLSDALPKHMSYVTDENRRRYKALLDTGLPAAKVMTEHITKHPAINGFAVIGASGLAQLDELLAIY